MRWDATEGSVALLALAGDRAWAPRPATPAACPPLAMSAMLHEFRGVPGAS